MASATDRAISTEPTATLGGRLLNTATVGTPSPGDNPANNRDTAITNVGGAALEITKDAAPDLVQAGGQVLYTLILTNTAGETAEGLAINDRVPFNTTFVDASPASALVGGVVTWHPADLVVGDRVVVTFAVRVDTPLVSGTQIVNDAYGASADNAPSPPTDRKHRGTTSQIRDDVNHPVHPAISTDS